MNFDQITKVVINLPHRTDRREQFISEMLSIKPGKTAVVFQDGIIDDKPYVGIAKAHIQAIDFVLNKMGKYCAMVMEDDVHFPGRERTIQHINECLKHIPGTWDILLGGVYTGDLFKYNDYWNHIEKFSGLHFYIVNRAGFAKLKKYDFSTHLDRWISGQNLNLFVMDTFCAIQQDGFSDNVGHQTAYNAHLEAKYKILK